MKWRDPTFMDDMRSSSDIQDADFTNQRVARPPLAFSVDVTNGKAVFSVKDRLTPRDRETISAYRVYFVPEMAVPKVMSELARQAAYRVAKFVCDIPTTGDSETLTAECSIFYGKPGLYYCVSVNNSGTEGQPTQMVSPQSQGSSSSSDNGAGGLRETIKLNKYAQSGTQRSGATQINCFTDGSYNGGITVSQSMMASAGIGFRMRAMISARNVTFYDGGGTYNTIRFQIIMGSTTILTITQNNNITTGVDHTWDIVGDIQFQSVSGTNTSVMAFLSCQVGQPGPATGANGFQNFAVVNVPNTSSQDIILTHRTVAGTSASYYYWYNRHAYLWQIL